MTHVTAQASSTSAARFIKERLLERNLLSEPFFAQQADSLARASSEMADRFARGGRLLALGKQQYATDAQHVEVEFVHPVLVGKRALPAVDISHSYRDSLRVILRPADMVMAFAPPGGDPELSSLMSWASAEGAQTFALSGSGASYSLSPSDMDPFIHQELIEILYHTLWETVHVFLEHRELGYDAGQAGFLYPFLGRDKPELKNIIADVASSIRTKAAEDERLRDDVAAGQADAIARATFAIYERVRRRGRVLLFGNGGSATDANDWALDFVASPKAHEPVPALSLAAAPAVVSAVANDVGVDQTFLRQIIAHGEPADVAIAVSTSGGSRNVISALLEARKRGMLTVALLGHDGGEVLRRAAADHTIIVRSDNVPRIQEVQASIYHVMLDLLDAIQRQQISEP